MAYSKFGLFVPCYVNALYPEAGVATWRLLEYLGAGAEYPAGQTCCGQPMANAGFEREAEPLLRQFDRLFALYDFIITPSASCAAFVKEHLDGMNGRLYEICEYLHDVAKVETLPGKFPHKVSIHNSCHGVRKLHLSSASEQMEPRYSKLKKLLSMVEGIEVAEPACVDECCGFGGMFSIEEPAVSVCMGQDKLKNHLATGAEYITGADSSCLMHLQGIARREKMPARFIHISQILAAGL
ncbi:MAG: (Fe-S)-binding protein [Tannerellaceae bacterium]|jgi:L-lactate dehydrogenase complex protein LldE|nr:(Fe-S)-binding protein [Tannerellaceae bacterium]